MIKKTLAVLILITSVAPIKSYATGFTALPLLTITAPTQILTGQEPDLSNLGCPDLTVLLFATIFCGIRDVAEVKMDAENVVFGSAISDAARARLGSFVKEIKEKVPAARNLEDEAVILEVANSQVVSK
ncbi:MAG: hypothetical protein ACXVCR_10085 [Bdellovibrio sp.]